MKRILIVADKKVLNLKRGKIEELKNQEIELIEANSLVGAEKKIITSHFDCVIYDWEFPMEEGGLPMVACPWWTVR